MPYQPPITPNANMQRNNITTALMDIARPPPQAAMPQGLGLGMPQMPVPGGPPAGSPLPQVGGQVPGTPMPGMTPPNVPLSSGIPPQMPQGVPPSPTMAPRGVPMRPPGT